MLYLLPGHHGNLYLPPLCSLQVAKGYGSHDSTKLISTRILQDIQDWVMFDSIIEASAVQSNPFTLRYLHDFRHVFKVRETEKTLLHTQHCETSPQGLSVITMLQRD